MAVMKKFTAICFLWVTGSSCFLSHYTKSTFMYTSGTQSYTVPIIVPKGYTKERTEVDSSGNTILSYWYGTKTSFYVAHLEDSSAQLQPPGVEGNMIKVDEATGIAMYKGPAADTLLWKEVRRQKFRTGYRHVPRKWEARFDSAANFCTAKVFEKNF